MGGTGRVVVVVVLRLHRLVEIIRGQRKWSITTGRYRTGARGCHLRSGRPGCVLPAECSQPGLARSLGLQPLRPNSLRPVIGSLHRSDFVGFGSIGGERGVGLIVLYSVRTFGERGVGLIVLYSVSTFGERGVGLMNLYDYGVLQFFVL